MLFCVLFHVFFCCFLCVCTKHTCFFARDLLLLLFWFLFHFFCFDSTCFCYFFFAIFLLFFVNSHKKIDRDLRFNYWLGVIESCSFLLYFIQLLLLFILLFIFLMLIPLFLLLLLISIHPFARWWWFYVKWNIFEFLYYLFISDERWCLLCILLLLLLWFDSLLFNTLFLFNSRKKRCSPTEIQKNNTHQKSKLPNYTSKNLKSISIVVYQTNRKSILNSFHNIGRSIVVWCFLALCAEICGAFLFLK